MPNKKFTFENGTVEYELYIVSVMDIYTVTITSDKLSEPIVRDMPLRSEDINEKKSLELLEEELSLL